MFEICDDCFQRREMLSNFAERFEEVMWRNVTEGESTGGVEKGTPSIEPAKKCHKWIIRKGMQQQANCLEAVVTHTVWNATRASADPQFIKCRRCGAEHETQTHKFWECPANKLIESKDVKD